jgi:cytoskeletal protein CcmA (bactofilin family)
MKQSGKDLPKKRSLFAIIKLKEPFNMKRLLLLFVGLTGALSLLWVGVLVAADFRTGDSPTVMSNETIDGTLYSAGTTIRVDGTVKGDLICGGQQVTVSGTVEGDVLCAAQSITVTGHVTGSIRSAAQSISVTGKVDGSVTIAAMTATIGSDAVVGRDLTIAAQDATLDGTVVRDTQVGSRTFSTNAKLGRDLNVKATTITLSDKTTVGGNFAYASEADATVASGAHITGKTTHHQPPKSNPTPEALSISAFISALIFGFASFLLLGLALLGASPRLLAATSHAITKSPLGTIGVGLLALVLPPVIAVMVFVTVIGIPLALVILLTWLAAMIMALSVSSHALGKLIVAKLKWQEHWPNFAALVIGVFILFLLALIPYVGGYVMFVALIWGLGGFCYAAVSQRRMTIKVVTKKS